ncbi:MAG: hypothetical protein E7083_07650 [Bacteroidales bacterium]|nr:hypothetical protein [Bacteroidales bacterium]
MKKVGAKMEYADERMADLMRLYHEYLRECKHISLADVYEKIVNLPSRRFWVSSTHALKVVSAILRGEDILLSMRRPKAEMYIEIFRRVMQLKEREPSTSIAKLCEQVVQQPAPKIYLSPGSAKIMIYQYRRDKRRNG